jgi:hypothetical protein
MVDNLWIISPQVTEADIEEFEAKYRGSDSEKKDLKDLYTKYKGNMNRWFLWTNLLSGSIKPVPRKLWLWTDAKNLLLFSIVTWFPSM